MVGSHWILNTQNFSIPGKWASNVRELQFTREQEEFMPGSRVHECVASEASLNYECITIIFMVFIRWWCEVNQNFPSTDPRLWTSVKWRRKILMCIANASSQISYYPFSCMQKGKTKSLDLYIENKICENNIFVASECLVW